jgi:hypothetical protein
MTREEVTPCIEKIKELTGCSTETAWAIFYLVADYTGGNTPD